MKHKLLTVLVFLLWATYAQAQTVYTPNLKLGLPHAAPNTWGDVYNDNFEILDGAIGPADTFDRVTSATKPTSPIVNQVVVVTDAFDGTTCTTGGGISNNTCQWTGSAWVVIGGSASGGAGTPAGISTSVQFNDSSTFGADTDFTYNKTTNILAVPSGGDILIGAVSVCQENGTNCPGAGGSEPADADLTALAANSTDGLWTHTAAGAGAARTITGTSGNVVVTNGNGVSGNPVLDVGSTIVQTDQVNTYGAFHQNFTSASLTLPNSAGASPSVDNQLAVDTTAGAVKVRINGGVVSLATTLGTFTAFAVDPAGCILANGEWTNDTDASGVSNCVRIFSSGAAAPTAGTVRFVGEIYQDTRAYSCSTQTGLTYIGQTVGGNFVPILAQPDGYTTITGDSGAASPCGGDTFKIEGSTTIVTAVSSGTPDKVSLYSRLLTHATDCTAVTTGKDGQACYEQDSDRIFVCEPTAGDCDTAGEWKLASGAGGGGTPAGATDDIQFNSAGSFGGGRCTMDSSANISCAGSMTTGAGGGVSGSWQPYGATSGNANWGVADVAGTPNPVKLPTANGNAGDVLVNNGANPALLSWSGAYKVRPCEIHIGDNGAASPVLAADNDATESCANSYGVTLKIDAVKCYSATGAPTVKPIITGGAATSILTAAFTCTSTAGGASGTLNGAPTQTTGQTIDANIDTVDGVSKRVVMKIERTLVIP